MIELLKLLGFEDEEIPTELPRIEKAFGKLGISDEDIERGRQRLKKYYAVELEGVRKIFRFIVREFVASLLVKEEGKKALIYGFMSPGMEIIGSALASRSKDVFSIYHCWAFHIVVGCIFGKMEPFLEEAEKKWLKAGMVAHCANIKTLLGPLLLDIFPKPDLLVTSGILCEASPKTLELLHALHNIPVSYIDTCQDREQKEYADGTWRTSSLTAKSLRKTVEKIQGIVGFELTDDLLSEAQEAKREMALALDRIEDLVTNSNPLTISPAHENIWVCLYCLSPNITEITEITEVLKQLYEELKERTAKGVGVVEKDAPRVLATLPMGQTDPRFEHLASELGIAIVANDVMFSDPLPKNTKDPFLNLCLVFQHGMMSMPVGKRISLIIDGCKKLKIDGVLDRYHVGCRSVAADALLIEKVVKKELGIPVMTLEWENFDPRVFRPEEYKRQLEGFKAMMLSSAARKRASSDSAGSYPA